MTATIYSIESANSTLPLVGSILGDLVKLTAQIVEARTLVARLRDDPTAGEDARNDAFRALRSVVGERDSCVAELGELSVTVGDAERGVCDFPAEIDGERIYLCWMLGEEQVAFCHDVDEGFAGRRPLPQTVGV